jgi:3-oxoacyl-[acyl-carrier protein] reductase
VNLSFAGRTVVVTGGSRGIGASTVELFAAAGASVVINYLPVARDLEGLDKLERRLRETGARYEALAADITSPRETEQLCRLAVERFGSLDVLVNCAGLTIPVSLEGLSAETWQRLVEVNLSGAFYVMQSASRQMLAQKSGRIIFIGSAGSLIGGGGSAAYASAKAGINGLVRALSKELAPHGITVNAILPALIETDLLRDREPDPQRRQDYVKRVPVGRLGRPEDVAYLALFLASEYAGFITGQNILVDGGSTLK